MLRKWPRGVYMVGFDRAGYGESDPNPARSVRSAALDMEELADALGLGDRFYAVGFSLGCHAVWGALRYIPHRLAGAAMLAPVVSYWWPGFSAAMAAEGRRRTPGRRAATSGRSACRTTPPGSSTGGWTSGGCMPTSTVVSNTTHLPQQVRRRGPPHPRRRRHALEEARGRWQRSRGSTSPTTGT